MAGAAAVQSNIPLLNERDCFERRFKVIYNLKVSHSLTPTILEWVNTYSTGQVQVKIIKSREYQDKWYPTDDENSHMPHSLRMYVAFEDKADALIFKIKYL